MQITGKRFVKHIYAPENIWAVFRLFGEYKYWSIRFSRIYIIRLSSVIVFFIVEGDGASVV